MNYDISLFGCPSLTHIYTFTLHLWKWRKMDRLMEARECFFVHGSSLMVRNVFGFPKKFQTIMLLPWTKKPQTNNPSACYHSSQQIQCQMHTGYGCARPISSHFRFILNDLSVFVSVCVAGSERRWSLTGFDYLAKTIRFALMNAVRK